MVGVTLFGPEPVLPLALLGVPAPLTADDGDLSQMKATRLADKTAR